MATDKPKTSEEAMTLAEMWDQVADDETAHESEYHRLRARAARYRELADRLPSRESRPQDLPKA